MDQLSTAETEWLRDYFTLIPGLGWPLVAPSGQLADTATESGAWVDFWAEAPGKRPFIAPLEVNSDGTRAWIACAGDFLAASQMCEELQAHLGTAYTDFSPTSRITQESAATTDARAQLALQRFAWVYRFERSGNTPDAIVWRMLALYRHSLGCRPDRSRLKVVSFGQLKQAFEHAILAGNETEAYRLLDELKATGRLNAQNERFVEVHLLASMGRWSAMVTGEAKLLSLRDLKLPRQVLAEAIEGVYQHYLARHEEEGQKEAALAAFNEQVRSRFGWLFQARNGIRLPAVLKSFALHELSGKAPDPQLLTNIADELAACGETTPILSWLTQHTLPVEETDFLAKAVAAYDDAEYERALSLFMRAPQCLDALRGMLDCANEIETAEAAAETLAAIASYPSSLILALPARHANIRKRLETLADEQAATDAGIDGWDSWAKAVNSGMAVEEALQVAADRASTWRLADYVGHPARVLELANELGRGLDSPVFMRATPMLFDFFCTTQHHADLKPMHQVLLTLMLLQEAPGRSELELVQSLVSSILEAGLGEVEYRILLEDIRYILVRIGSLQYLGWGMDVAELFAIFPSPDNEARLRLFFDLVELAGKHNHRLRGDQWEALEFLGKDFGQPDTVRRMRGEAGQSDEASGSWYDGLAGKLVAIYTLTESAGARAREILLSLCPTCRVEVNADLVATSRLRHLAANSDIFVFAWRSSKHQSFFCVRDSRAGKPNLMMARGKGTASILQAVNEALNA